MLLLDGSTTNSTSNTTYLLKVEKQAVGRQGAATEEVVAHPAILVVARHVFVRENVHKQLQYKRMKTCVIHTAGVNKLRQEVQSRGGTKECD